VDFDEDARLHADSGSPRPFRWWASVPFLVGVEQLCAVGVALAIDAGNRPLSLLLGAALAACVFATEGRLHRRRGAAESASMQ